MSIRKTYCVRFYTHQRHEICGVTFSAHCIAVMTGTVKEVSDFFKGEHSQIIPWDEFDGAYASICPNGYIDVTDEMIKERLGEN